MSLLSDNCKCHYGFWKILVWKILIIIIIWCKKVIFIIHLPAIRLSRVVEYIFFNFNDHYVDVQSTLTQRIQSRISGFDQILISYYIKWPSVKGVYWDISLPPVPALGKKRIIYYRVDSILFTRGTGFSLYLALATVWPACARWT